MVDYNNSKRISIDDFFKVLYECNININSYELQSIFQDSEIFSNGVVYYNKIIDNLFEKYYSKQREIYAEKIYDKLTNNGQIKISLNDIRNIYYNIPNNSPRKKIFMEFIDKYKYITKGSIDKPITLYEMKKLIKYIGYGIEFDDQLYDLLYELENNNNNNFKSNYYNNQNLKSNSNYDNYYNYENENKIKNENIIIKLRKYLIKYGRKSFFNFIKQFKYYDNNTRTISKYDFMKVLQDFNIRIPDSDINQLFNEYGVNYKKSIINYLNFLKELSNFSLNKNRENEIKKAANFIYNKSNELRKPINLNFLKEIYSPENNYFIRDSYENKIDFIDCLELFHYAFKGFNHDIFYEEEFIEFYHYISFLIENDNNFISLLNNEWREKEINKIENNNNFNFTFGQKNQNNENYNLKNQNRHFNYQNNNYENNNNEISQKYKKNRNENNYNNNNPLQKLKEKLKIRGVRGLLYLHKQFLLSCPNTSKILLNDFKKILLSQHITFSDSEYENIFYQFSKDNLYLDFISFIREFKKELNEIKLNYVEDAYSVLNINQNEKVPIEYIKRKYDAKNHPDVILGKKTEEEKLLEFIDCFEINFDLLNQYSNVNFIDFEIFANFYEYVAFVYDDDNIFGKILKSTFH